MTVTTVCEPLRLNAVSRLPTPATEPPYDDEIEAQPANLVTDPVQGALALAFQLPGGLPAVPAVPLLRLLPQPEDAEADADFFKPQSTPVTALPNPRMFAGRLVQAMLEVAVAARPLAQLVRWTNEDVYRQLARLVRIAGLEVAMKRSRRAPGRVRSVHVSEPRGNVIEVCAIVQQGPRATAIALRMEGVDGRWQCTALQFG
jgi:hypothetical protein